MSECGFASTCGRPLSHRGQHGGWRTGVSVVAEQPYSHAHPAKLGSQLTPTELRSLVEYACHGEQGAAAACLGLSVQTVKNHISSVHAKTGATTTLGIFGLLGWLRVPDGLGALHAVVA